MDIQIYSLSKDLAIINKILQEQIVLITPKDLYSSVIYNQSAYIIFKWCEINYVKRSINNNNTENTQFICIDEDISPENRLYLLNNNIEFLTKEKFSHAKVHDFITWTKKEKHKVLIIEDDMVQALINETILKTSGILVKSIRTSIDSVEMIDFFEPDLVLIALDHKIQSTINLLKSIRNNTENLSLPIVFLSSGASEEAKIKIIDDGADEVIIKPIRAELLVSSLLNRMQGKFFQPEKSHKEIQEFKSNNHRVLDQEYDNLSKFIERNSHNEKASVIWIKIINKPALQKSFGLSGFKNLCDDLLSQIPNLDASFDLKLAITDGVFAFASSDLTRSKARFWIDSIHEWLRSQFFSIRENDANVVIQSLILSNIPKKSNINLLIQEAERLLINPKSSKNNAYIGEGEEQKKFYLIKAKLENAIKAKNFKWLYQTILNTKNENQEIIQLMMRIVTSEGTDLKTSDYLEVANEAGLLKLLDRFTLEQAITMIQEGESVKIERRILLNQLLNDYESDTYREKTLAKIKSYKLPKGRLIFQFRQDMTDDHTNLINGLGKKLRQASIIICLSEFDGSALAWSIAKTLGVDWIRIKPFKAQSDSLNKNSSLYVGKIIQKAHKQGYRVMLPNIDSANLTANIWSLNADYIQGNFIQEPVSDLKYIEGEVVC